MKRVKIAITSCEPVLHTEYYPVFEDSPFLIIVDEYNHIQKYIPEISADGKEKSKVEWIIARGAKILVTGSMRDKSYMKLKNAGIAVKWEAFGDIKSLVDRARIFSGFLLEMLEKERPAKIRYKRNARDVAASTTIDTLEKKATRSSKRQLLKSMYANEDDEDDYPTSGPQSHSS